MVVLLFIYAFRYCHLCLEESQQISVDLVLKSRAHTVWRSRIDLQYCVFDAFCSEESRTADGYDLVVVAMKNQCRDVKFSEIFRKVRFGKSLDAIDDSLETGLHPLQPE